MNIAGSIKIFDRSEPFTVRELRDMVESRAYKQLLARLDNMIDSEHKLCEQAADADAWRQAQGALRALRAVKNLPTILEAEVKKGP